MMISPSAAASAVAARLSSPSQGGLLRGYESVKVTLDFSPMQQGLYSARAALLLLPAQAAVSSTMQAGLPGASAAASAAGASLVQITPTALEYGKAAAADLDADEQQHQAEGEEQQGAPGSFGASAAGCSPFACEKLIMSITAEATQGALCIEPASLAFGDVNVGYPQRKTLKLINQSAGVLRYHVTVLDELPKGVDSSEVLCEFGSAAAVLSESMSGAAGSRVSAAGTAGSDDGGGGAAADCSVDAPEGLLDAR